MINCVVLHLRMMIDDQSCMVIIIHQIPMYMYNIIQMKAIELKTKQKSVVLTHTVHRNMTVYKYRNTNI